MAQQGPVAVPAYGVALYRVPRPGVVLGGVVLGAVLAVTWLAAKAVSPIEYVVATDEVALALVALWALRPKRLAAQRREGQAGERSARGLPVPLPSGLAARFAILAGMSTDDIDRRALSATLPLDVPDEEIAGVRDVS